MKSVGIDIGSHQVKVVEIQSHSKGFQLTQYHIKQLTRAPGTDQELEVIEFLRELLPQYDPVNTRICVALRQERVAVRLKQFGFSDRLKIQKTLPFDLEEDLPFSLDNAVFDGKIVRTLGAGAEVLACAAPKTQISHLLRVLKDSGIEPHVLTTEGSAFANLFEKWSEPIPAFPAPVESLEGVSEKAPRPIRVVVNLGHRRSLVCAFDGDLLVGVRSIPWGGKNIADSIATKYNLPPADALKEMENKAFILTSRQDASYEAKLFSDLVAKCVRELVRDLQLSLLEFRSEFGGVITQIQMTGGLSHIQGLGPFLTQHLEVPVNKIQILDFFPQVLFEKNPVLGSRLGVAIGLALEGLRKPRNPALNFLRGEFARQSSFAKDLWKEWGPYVKVGSISIALLFVWSYLRIGVAESLEESSRQVLREQAKAVANLSGRSANEASIKRHIQDNRRKVTEIRTLESLAGMNSAFEILQKISSSVPDAKSIALDLSSVLIQDDQVVIEGKVRGTAATVDILSRTLAAASADGNVQKQSVQPAGAQTNFKLAFRVDRNIQKVQK